MFVLRMMVCRSPDGDGGSGGGSDAGAGGGETTVPVAALQAERKSRQELEKRLADIESAKKADDERRATEAGEHKKLYEELKPKHESTAARLAELEKREEKRLEKLSERNSTRIKALPESAQKMRKPISAALSPEALDEWLEEHGGTLGAEITRPSGTLGGGGGKKVEDPIPTACTQEWERHGKSIGMSEREWYDINWLKRHPKK